MGSFIIYGNEPWIIRRQKESFKSKCPDLTMGYSEFTDVWDAKNFLLTLNLFTESLYAILRVPDTKEIAGKDFLEFLSTIKDDSTKQLLIEVEKVTDKDRGLVKLKEVASFVTEYSKITQKDKFQQVFQQILVEQDAKMDEKARVCLLERLDYFNNDATNLVTIENYIGQLKYLGEWITADDVERNTPDLREGKRFKLASMIAKGHKAAVLDEVARLKSEKDFNVFGILSILFKEYRVSYLNRLGFPVKEQGQGVFCDNMKGLSQEDIVKGMNIITDKTRDICNGVYTDEEAFDIALTELMCLCLSEK